jgi:lipid-A-disaccharide synthase
MPRIFLVAGESSGDIHGANLVRALRDLEPAIQYEGLGGSNMAAAGVRLHCDLANRAIMGFVEVVRSLPFIRRLFRETVERLRSDPPDCLVLIDYPGFNMRLAAEARKLGVRVIYYISPQVWAWKKGRLQKLAATVDKMLVILPFEADLYREAGLACTYVGHPLLDHIPNVPIEGRFRTGTTVGLLPGSRSQEIERLLPVMLKTAQGLLEHRPDLRFAIPCVDEEREAQIRAIIARSGTLGDLPIEIVVGKAYEVLAGARFCLVASGTATVEACLFGVPMIILYRVAPITYWMARVLVDVPHIGMVNILAERRIVPEFIQEEAAPGRIVPVALDLLEETSARAQMLEDLGAVRKLLGGGGASRKAAAEILALIRGEESVNTAQ